MSQIFAGAFFTLALISIVIVYYWFFTYDDRVVKPEGVTLSCVVIFCSIIGYALLWT